MSHRMMIEELEKSVERKEHPDFRVGDTVKVYQRIIEGEKERLQVFEGIVIGRQGKSVSETFSIYRIAFNVGMERTFFLHSPRISKIVVVKKGRVRRAKLYYLLGKFGKGVRIQKRSA